ncbi:MAG: DUF1565 domain-containing protein [Pseudomonas sp.]
MTGEVIYNTGNPVPSADAYDRHDNTRVFDGLLNASDPTVTGRTGKVLKTWAGFESDFYQFLQGTAFELPPLTYTDGSPLQVDRATQLIERSGLLYGVKLPQTLPYSLSGTWTADEPFLTVRNDQSLRQELAMPDGGQQVGVGEGTVDGVMNGSDPFGPPDQRVDQITGGNADPDIGGPFIKRRWCTTAPLSIFVDPAVGADTNPGTQVAPLRSITAALQLVPQNIYHKVRIYLLDGDYGSQRIKVFNYFVSARGTAGFRIIGHVANFDGDIHPIYTDNKPENVIIRGQEHVISGISGTEEFALGGMTFVDGWVESYDAFVLFERCDWEGGHYAGPGRYNARHAVGGHNSVQLFNYCNFRNLASIGSFTGDAHGIFSICTLSGLNLTSSSSVNGIPFRVGDKSSVKLKSSPTLLVAGPGGKPDAGNGEASDAAPYSAAGYPVIRRSAPTRDEQVVIVAHDGSTLAINRGAGLELNGMSYATNPGQATLGFGPTASARAVLRYTGTQAGGAKDAFVATAYGDCKAEGAQGFGVNGNAVATFLSELEGCLYVDTATGDVRIAVKKGGVTKWAKVFGFATATPF